MSDFMRGLREYIINLEGNMAKYLVIVESPAKVKTIKKFLGSNYEVMASNGHVRDLPKSQLGVDVAHDYEPKYITIRGKGDILAGLRKEVKKADKVYLATDPDREGEAISWHLSKALNLEEKDIHRITFNEITKTAVKASLKEPRKIDQNLVDAQQTRRILDRMVGYEISPVLWAKVKRGLSAGRVQSVALRLICSREEEISAFIPEEYWSLDVDLTASGLKKPLTAHYYGTNGKKEGIASKEQAEAIMKAIEGKQVTVVDLQTRERSRKAPLPFTTSTLQQEAANVLNFSTQKTMRLAQQLYEGIDVAGEGTIGLITYLRTDSTRIAAEADEAARAYITEAYGSQYITQNPRESASAGKIQDAHEAIRPTNIRLEPVRVKDSLSRDQFRLYQLIWKRFAASRMADAKYQMTQAKLEAAGYQFTSTSSHVAFDGFLNVYVPDEEKETNDQSVLALQKGMELTVAEWKPEQHFTQPPAHYTEASLVKSMEEKGIGRPSTYAPTITTILARHYIIKEKKNLYVTELGEIVNHIMEQSFPTFVDTEFTANLESLLDMVSEGKLYWKDVVRNFYPDLAEAVRVANKELEHVKVQDELSDEYCEICGRQMVIKYGPHGKFLACPGFPDCRNTKPYLEKIGMKCPKCGKEIVIRKTKKGRKYYGCENNPECDFMSWSRPSGKNCPKCGSYLIVKGNKNCCSNEACGYTEPVSEK